MSFLNTEELKKLPKIYEQDGKGDKAIVHLVISLGKYVWLITEYSPEDDMFFGFACLNDPEMAELGYISREEFEYLSKGYSNLKAEYVHMELKDAKDKYINE